MVVNAVKARENERAWGHELAVQIRRRVFWFSCALVINVVFAVTGWGHTSLAVQGVFVSWLVLAGVQEWLRRRITSSAPLLILSGTAFSLDVVFITLVMYMMGGGWWVGTAFSGTIVAVAAGSLPRNWSITVLASAILSVCVLLAAQTVGPFHPAPWFGMPPLRGNAELAFTVASLNALALAALWSLSRFQVLRVARSRQRFQQVVDAAPYMIFTLDKAARVRSVNPAALRSTGFCLADLSGRRLLRFIDRADRARVLEGFHEALGGHESRLEHRFLHADGQMRWVSVTYAPVLGPKGTTSVLVIGRDLTQERRTAEHQMRLERDLAASQRMELVGRLVSGVAHELNNPLAAVLTLTEQLLHDAAPGSDAQALRIVHEQALRARAIVRDLLEVARNRSDRPREAASLASLARGVAEGMSHVLDERSLDVRVFDTDDVPMLRVDTAGIAQVLANLIRNAAYASPVGGTIDVRIRRDGDHVAAQVTDQGAGIPADVMPHLCEPFFTTKPPGQGTGLGLAVSKGIVEQHGGSLTAENGKHGSGIGAELTIRLPLSLAADADSVVAPVDADLPFVVPSRDTVERDAAGHELSIDPVFTSDMVPREALVSRAHESSQTSPAPAVEQAEQVVRRLLLVDDESSIRMALERWLGRRGWKVESCANGQDALDRLLGPDAHARYDAIVCDLKMPGVSGVQLYQRLSSERPDLIDRLILATGDVASVDVARFLATVQCPVLEKPFELKLLDETLARLPALS